MRNLGGATPGGPASSTSAPEPDDELYRRAVGTVNGPGAHDDEGLFHKVMGGLEAVLGAPRRAVMAGGRAVGRLEGLDIPESMSPGQVVREAAGLSTDPAIGQQGNDTYGRRIAGGLTQLGGDVGADPTTYLLGGAGKLAGLGKTATAALEAGGRLAPEALGALAPEAAAAAQGVASSGRIAHALGRGAAAAFAPGMAIASVGAAQDLYHRLLTEGMSPGAAEDAVNAATSGAFAVGTAGHALGIGGGRRIAAPETAAGVPAEPGFVAPEQPFELPADRAFGVEPVQPQAATFGLAPEAAGYRPPGPPVDVLAEREFLTPDREAQVNAEQAARGRQFVGDQGITADALNEALQRPPGPPRLAPPTGGFPEGPPLRRTPVESPPAGEAPPFHVPTSDDALEASIIKSLSARPEAPRLVPTAVQARDTAELGRVAQRLADIPDAELASRERYYRREGLQQTGDAVREEITKRAGATAGAIRGEEPPPLRPERAEGVLSRNAAEPIPAASAPPAPEQPTTEVAAPAPTEPPPDFRTWAQANGYAFTGDRNMALAAQRAYLEAFPGADREQFRPGAAGGPVSAPFVDEPRPPNVEGEAAAQAEKGSALRELPRDMADKSLRESADLLETTNLTRHPELIADLGLEGIADKPKLVSAIRQDADNPLYLKALEQHAERIADNTKYSARPLPGQRGLPGMGEDVAPPQERKPQPEQRSMFGGEMLHGVEARTTEGREGAGPLFTQEEETRARAERDSQGNLKYATAPAFYSQLERVASKIPQAMRGEDMLRYLSDSKRGVKADEMKWTGLDDFLKGKAGQKVTPQDVQDFLAANRVEVKEVTKGRDRGPALTPEEVRELHDLRAEPSDELSEAEHARMAALEDKADAEEGSGDAKFSQYVLPGGENYREVLLTLPNLPGAGTEIVGDKGQHEVYMDGRFFSRNDTRAQAEANARALRENPANAGRSFDVRPTKPYEVAAQEFKSSHFDEPNILAHVRFNDRVDSAGKKTLFIEEVQSDWAQKGRKEGFGGNPVDERRLSELSTEYDSLQRAARGPTITLEQSEARDRARARTGEIADEMNKIRDRWQSNVPSAPFVGATEDWSSLAMKHVLKYAAENGYARVAWTKGETQERRYWGHEAVAPAVSRWSEVTKPESIRELGKDVLGPEMSSLMSLNPVDGGVLSVLQHDQVRRAVVSLVPADVVDILASADSTPQQLLRDPEMVLSRLAPDSRSRVALGVRSAMRETGATIRAKLGGLKTAGANPELLPALKASDLSPREVASLLDPQRLFHLGTSGGPEEPASARARTEAPSGGVAGVGNGKLGSTELADSLNAHAQIIHGREGLLQQGFQPPPGEGMRGFYDRILPAVASKLGKKFGATVGETRIDTAPHEGGDYYVEVDPYGGGFQIFDHAEPDAPPIATFHTRAEADSYMRDQGQYVSVHSMDITPEMRRSVTEEGQPLFRATTAEMVPGITTDHIKAAFPSGKITEAEGAWDVALPGNRNVRVRVTPDGVEFNPEAFKAGYGRDISGAEKVVGSWQRIGRDGLISLAKEADQETVHHEAFHSAMDLALTDSEKAAVLKKYGTEEAAAEAYAKWTPETPNSWFGKILTMAKRLYRSFSPSWESAFERTRSGEAFGRAETSVAPGEGQRFAKAPKPTYVPLEPFERPENSNGNEWLQARRAAAERVGAVDLQRPNTPEFKRFFGNSKVVDEKGEPLPVYRGDNRSDRVGNKFKANKATSGRFYFTDDPEVASGYALNKSDPHAAEALQNTEDWFKFAPDKGSRTPNNLRTQWYRLDETQKARVRDTLLNTGQDPETNAFDFSGKNTLAAPDHWDYEVKKAHGNWLKAADEVWLQSGSLFGDEERFGEILKHAGLDATFDSPSVQRPGVLPAYLNIRRPLDTAAIPESVMSALERVAKSDRTRTKPYGVDAWDKSTITTREWFDSLKTDQAEGTTHAWTRVPEKVTQALQQMGYDGIKDTGGKMGGQQSNIWIAFQPEQIKSAIANRGTYDPGNADIRYATAPKPTEEFASTEEPFKPKEREFKIGSTSPGGRPPTPEEAPQVEHRVEGLRGAEQAAGVESMDLARDSPRTWESLDPKIQKVLRDTPEETLRKRAENGNLDDVGTQAWAAVVQGKRESMERARAAVENAKAGLEDSGIANANYLGATLDYVAAEGAHIKGGTITARALAARARIMNAGANVPQAFLKRVFREIEGVSDKQAAELLRVFTEDPGSLPDVLRATIKPTLLDKFLEFWKAGLVSAPGTQLANVAGNAIEQTAWLGETLTAAAIDKMVPGERARGAGEARAELAGAGTQLREATRRFWDEAKSAFTLGPEQFDLTKGRLEGQIGAIAGKKGRAVRIPFRMLQAADSWFAQVASGAELGKRAYRRAAQELGASAAGDAIERRAGEIRANPSKALLDEVQKASLARTFHDEPGTLAKSILSARRQNRLLNLVVPFVNTPASIARRTIQRSPIGFLLNDSRKAYGDFLRAQGEFKGGKIGRDAYLDAKGAAIDALARPALGTAILGSFAALAQSGGMTGSGPTDPKERNLLRETGWQPYSFVVNVGGKKNYIPFNRFEPVSSTLGFAADMVEARDSKKAGDFLDKTIGSITQNLTSKTYLQGLADAGALIANPAQAASQYVSGLAGSLVPNIVAKAEQAYDPTLRDVSPSTAGIAGAPEKLAKTVAARVPGLAEMLPAKKSSTGEDIERPGNALTRFALPVQPSQEKEGTEVESLLVNLGYAPSQPTKDFTIPGSNGKKLHLEPEEYSLMQQANKRAADYIRQNFVGNRRFSALDPEEQKKAVERVYDQARDSQRRQLYAQPSFRSRASALLGAR